MNVCMGFWTFWKLSFFCFHENDVSNNDDEENNNYLSQWSDDYIINLNFSLLYFLYQLKENCLRSFQYVLFLKSTL